MHDEKTEQPDPKQFGRPTGEDGKRVLENMNIHHRELAEWALSVLPEMDPMAILDIGCGGGMLISLMGKRYGGTIRGVDISEDAVELASSINSDLIESGRCSISKASVSSLPFKDGTFDLVTAFETYFFWPELKEDIKEAARTVGPGGILLIVSETYPHPDFKERNDRIITEYGLNIRENREIAEMMEDAGLQVEIVEIEENNWVAFIGVMTGAV